MDVVRIVPGLVAVALTGCTMRAKPQVSAPPPVVPVAQAPRVEPPPAPPVTFTQTNVQLPRPQPISAEALASIPNVPDTQAPVRSSRRAATSPPVSSSLPPTSLPSTTQRAEVTQGEPEPPAAPSVEEPQRPRIRPILSAEERRRKQQTIESRRREVEKLLEQIATRNLSSEEQSTVSRIESFLSISREALKRGDIRQADALSERALLLARDLQNAK